MYRGVPLYVCTCMCVCVCVWCEGLHPGIAVSVLHIHQDECVCFASTFPIWDKEFITFGC